LKTVKKIVIPEEIEGLPVTEIYGGNIYTGAGVFKECPNLTSLTIPNSVIRIGFDSFRGCVNLTTVEIPDHLIAYPPSNITDFNLAFCTCPKLTLKCKAAIRKTGYSEEF
jgi:hypothetical protein